MKDQTDHHAASPDRVISGADHRVQPSPRTDVSGDPGPTVPASLQLTLTAIAEATRDLDLETLSGLDEQALAAQRAARWELYRYLDQLWSNLKAVGLQRVDPVARQSIAGLRDVAGGLCAATDHLRFRPTADASHGKPG